jgi:dephospho-CoA kinase
MFVGLTGLIGAGKTTAAEILESFGAKVIDADRIGRRVVDDSPALRRRLARAFGPDVISDRGRLDRKLVAQRAFADETARKILNSLVHPYLLKELGKEMRRQARSHRIVVIDAALLLEWELDFQMDYTIVIDAPRDLRFRRLEERGLSREDALSREGRQFPAAEFLARADIVIDNSGTVDDLRARLRDVWDQLQSETEHGQR